MMSGFTVQAAELQVQLEGVKHDNGVVKVGLYRDVATFYKENQAFQALQAQWPLNLLIFQLDNMPCQQILLKMDY